MLATEIKVFNFGERTIALDEGNNFFVIMILS